MSNVPGPVTRPYDVRPFRTTAPVMSLPPEVLFMIFEYIHYPLRATRDSIRDEITSTRNIQDSDEPTTRGNVFPYPYVEVCKYWSDVILAVPMFWTNTVLYTGPIEAYGTYIEGPEAVLNASRKLPIDITIRSTRCDQGVDPSYNYFMDGLTPGDVKEEKTKIIELLKLIAPHLHRCRSLSLYTFVMNTVPLMYRHFSGPAPLLKMLTVSTDNESRLMTFAPNHSPVQSTFAPCLERLIIDGFSFFAIDKYHQHLREAYASSLVLLAVVNYDFQAEYWPDKFVAATAVAALQPFTALDTLKLERLSFAPDEAQEPPTTDLGMRKLVLDNMSNDALEQLFRVARFPELEEVWFRQCWVDGYEFDPNTLPDCPVLTLERVSDQYDLCPVLQYWEVSFIRSCASLAFDDDVLDMMGLPLDPEIAEEDVTHMTEFCCASLSALSIIVCPNITVAGLKRMVERRNRWVDYSNPQWRTSPPLGPAIMEIVLWELPFVIEYSQEDKEWFQAHVAIFKIETMSTAGLLDADYELDTSANITM